MVLSELNRIFRVKMEFLDFFQMKVEGKWNFWELKWNENGIFEIKVESLESKWNLWNESGIFAFVLLNFRIFFNWNFYRNFWSVDNPSLGVYNRVQRTLIINNRRAYAVVSLYDTFCSETWIRTTHKNRTKSHSYLRFSVGFLYGNAFVGVPSDNTSLQFNSGLS